MQVSQNGFLHSRMASMLLEEKKRKKGVLCVCVRARMCWGGVLGWGGGGGVGGVVLRNLLVWLYVVSWIKYLFVVYNWGKDKNVYSLKLISTK